MRNEAYLAQNALGYEGDSFIHEELKKLVKKFYISLAIETGTFMGATTKRLSELVDLVVSVEANEENYNKSKENCIQLKNVKLIFGNSAEVLPSLVSRLSPHQSHCILFYLDAHWEKYCPLLDELRAMADFKLKPVIFIHDFKVPGRMDLGYDCYANQVFDFNYIKSSIERIYGPDGYGFHYNSQAEGAKRGCIYIYPKQ